MEHHNQSISVAQFITHFSFEQITGDAASLERRIEIKSINRPGLEIAGYFDHAEKKRIVIIGNKEIGYLDQLDLGKQEARFDFITDDRTPLILVTGGNTCPETLKKVAAAKNFPIFRTEETSSEVMVDIIAYLNDMIAPSTNMHGVLLNVFGKGVMIMGESGMGKSEIALELITMGHSLVADDRVDIKRIKNQVIGTSAPLLKGLLEIRGIGIIDVMQMFGVGAYLEQEFVDFVMEFRPWNPQEEYMRVGIGEDKVIDILGVEVPHLIFPVKEGRNLAVLVESAVRNFLLRQRGFHAAEVFDERVRSFILEQSEGLKHD